MITMDWFDYFLLAISAIAITLIIKRNYFGGKRIQIQPLKNNASTLENENINGSLLRNLDLEHKNKMDTLYQHELGEHESNKLLEKISSIELNTDKEQNSKNTSNELCHEDLDTEETKNDSSLSIKVDNNSEKTRLIKISKSVDEIFSETNNDIKMIEEILTLKEDNENTLDKLNVSNQTGCSGYGSTEDEIKDSTFNTTNKSQDTPYVRDQIVLPSEETSISEESLSDERYSSGSFDMKDDLQSNDVESSHDEELKNCTEATKKTFFTERKHRKISQNFNKTDNSENAHTFSHTDKDQGDIINVLEEITADKLDLKSNDESCLINDDELNKYSVTETEFENYSGNGLNFDDTTEKSVEHLESVNSDIQTDGSETSMSEYTESLPSTISYEGSSVEDFQCVEDYADVSFCGSTESDNMNCAFIEQ